MHKTDNRPKHLGWVQVALQVANPDLLWLKVSGQSHYGALGRLAFIDVYGVDDDNARRRRIRARAGELMERLGYPTWTAREGEEYKQQKPVSAFSRVL